MARWAVTRQTTMTASTIKSVMVGAPRRIRVRALPRCERKSIRQNQVPNVCGVQLHDRRRQAHRAAMSMGFAKTGTPGVARLGADVETTTERPERVGSLRSASST